LITTIGVLFRPHLAIPLIISLYAVKQILIRFHPFFQGHPTFYNYAIGVVCSVGLLIGLIKNGPPKSFFIGGFFLFGLLMLSWLSVLWTPAPNAAYSAMVHFTLEAPLIFLLPLFTIRNADDYKDITNITVLFAIGTSLIVIFSPVAGIAGRNLIVSEGTVLSPATMILVAIIFLLFTNDYEKPTKRMILPVSLVLMFLLGLYMLGARTQFFIAALIVFFCSVFFVKRIQKILFTGLLFPTIIGLFIFIIGSAPDYTRNEIGNQNEVINRRYKPEDLKRGLYQRIEMIKPGLSLKAPLLGNGIMSWGYSVTNKDVYIYPHNSLIQLYYEVGLLGLFLFLGFIFHGVKKSVSLHNRITDNVTLKRIILLLLIYCLSSFLLSLKQGTFMSCLGVYCSIGMMLSLSPIQNHIDK
jgi:hypothetical protein